MAVISIPKILRDRLTEEGAQALAQILDRMEKQSQKTILEASEGRFEKRLTEVKGELKQDMGALRVEMQKMRADLLQWMFIFWVGQIGVLTGIMFAFFRK